MRIDHHAYQRATRVASFGMILQAFIGLILLIFGLISKDTAMLFGSMYTLSGLIVWLGLLVIFYQHKLERLEALEEDELASSRGTATSSMFEMEAGDLHVAARRLHLMHKWLMPISSLFLASLLGLLAWRMLLFLTNLNNPASTDIAGIFEKTANRGWAISLCLGASVAAFIFSRFVAGMAKQPVWQNLRGGAGYMVGTALLCLAVAVGIGFRFFENERVIEGIGYAIAFFMIFVAIEVILNFILNLYRPRIPGEVPRPAFDSKILSLFAAPDNLVRSMNEAVNYQFGFDVTSTWGYQLLLRSVVRLIVIGVVSMIALDTMVVIEPHQQAVKLSGGRIVGDVYEAGIMWKLPRPFQDSEVIDVSRIQSLYLTARKVRFSRPLAGLPTPNLSEVSMWKDGLDNRMDSEVIPFIVGASRLNLEAKERTLSNMTGESSKNGNEVSNLFSLVVAEIVLEYRIKREGGLKQYLLFTSDRRGRRTLLNDRERTLKSLALSEVNNYLSQLSIDEVLALGDASLADELKNRIQALYDTFQSGVEVVAIGIPMMRPIEGTEGAFEELSVSREARLQEMAGTNQLVTRTRIVDLGDPELLEVVLEGIEEWEQLRRDLGPEAPETIAQRVKVEQLLMKGGGITAQTILLAENDRWKRVMDAKTKASRIAGQIPAYRAAPNLYRQREIMRVFNSRLVYMRKYVVGIDPSRFNIDVELKELNPILNFADSILGEGEIAQ